MTKPARKAGAKGASIPYEPRRRGVTRPAIQSLLLPSRSGPTSQAGRTQKLSHAGPNNYESKNKRHPALAQAPGSANVLAAHRLEYQEPSRIRIIASRTAAVI